MSSMCGWCGTRTNSTNGVCDDCQSVEANARRGYTYAHGLYGGQWVPRNGRQVWQPHQRRRPTQPSFIVLPKPTLIEAAADIVKAVA